MQHFNPFVIFYQEATAALFIGVQKANSMAPLYHSQGCVEIHDVLSCDNSHGSLGKLHSTKNCLSALYPMKIVRALFLPVRD